MNHQERMEAVISGARPDRPPVALWRHFPVDDQTPYNLASASIEFQKTYDFDFLKVTPASSFCIKDWGSRDIWEGSTEGTRTYLQSVVTDPEDWYKLVSLDPLQGYLGAQLECLRLIKAELPFTPIVQTIFSPLSQAKNLVGRENLFVHLRRYPDALQVGLKTITESTIQFIEEALKTGIDGFFYAVQHAQYGLLSEAEYMTFGRMSDLQIMEPAKQAWLNILHLHGEDIMFEMFTDYPANVINWHDQETSPSLKTAQKKFVGVVCGGLRQWHTMVLGTPDLVRQEALKAIEATEHRRFILGTGCVTPIIAPRANILAARQVVEN